MASKEDEAFRELNAWESGMLGRLLKEAFPGCKALRSQVRKTRARHVMERGSPVIEFQVQDETPRADIRVRVPVEAEGRDSDGVVVHFLLHVVNARLSELEIYREDGNPIQRLPDSRTVTIHVNRE